MLLFKAMTLFILLAITKPLPSEQPRDITEEINSSILFEILKEVSKMWASLLDLHTGTIRQVRCLHEGSKAYGQCYT